MIEIGLHESLVFRLSCRCFLDPLTGKCAVLNLGQYVFHLLPYVLIHNSWSASKIAIGRRFTDELMHLLHAAFVQEINNELQFVHALVVSNFRLVAGIDQRFESGNDEFSSATAQNGLLTEKIGFGLFFEGGLDDSGSRAADSL